MKTPRPIMSRPPCWPCRHSQARQFVSGGGPCRPTRRHETGGPHASRIGLRAANRLSPRSLPRSRFSGTMAGHIMFRLSRWPARLWLESKCPGQRTEKVPPHPRGAAACSKPNERSARPRPTSPWTPGQAVHLYKSFDDNQGTGQGSARKRELLDHSTRRSQDAGYGRAS